MKQRRVLLAFGAGGCGTTLSNTLQLSRAGRKDDLVAAEDSAFLGTPGLQAPTLFSEAAPELHELFRQDTLEDILD